MCGICGVVGADAIADVQALDRMTRTLVHRGPDDRGTWSTRFELGGTPHAVGLGHTRLAILDLSPLGHQPMWSSDGSLAIVFNGEIYNFRALRSDLEALGSRFQSECDTEVLLEAYRHWGTEAFEQLIGMFAFALWDAGRQRLVLVRDRVGIKPLYYAFHDGLLMFGSELHALRVHPRFHPDIDRVALGGFLQRGFVTGPRTIYESVRRLQPGDYLVWEGGRISLHTYWRMAEWTLEPPVDSFDKAVDHLETLLGDAVELRLVSDVPLGAFLSGGIDSSAVVSLMCERASGRVRTFSIGFDDEAFDEGRHAAAVARHLRTEHTELVVRRQEAVAVAHELPQLYDEPFGDPSAIPTVLLSRLTRQHVTVALSGDGGDELFGGYRQYEKLDRLLPFLRVPRPLRRIAALGAAALPRGSLRRGLRHLGGASARDLAEGLLRGYEVEDVEAACRTSPLRFCPTYREAFAAAGTSDPIRASMMADARTYLPDDILTKVDRASMSVALEARVPLLDHRVVRFALALPRDVRWHGGKTKAPLREIAYRRVPRALLERPKQGFGIDLRTLLAQELEEWSRRHLSRNRLEEDGLLDPEGVERLRTAAQPGSYADTSRLWYLLCFQRWYACTHRAEELR